MPTGVIEATTDYRADSDPAGEFLQECVVESPNIRLRANGCRVLRRGLKRTYPASEKNELDFADAERIEMMSEKDACWAASLIHSVLEREPDLTWLGYRGGFDRSENFVFETERARTLKRSRHLCGEVFRAIKYLDVIPANCRHRMRVRSSYGLKHFAENWAGDYVSNGAMIIAALHRGFPVKPARGSLNAMIGSAERSCFDWPLSRPKIAVRARSQIHFTRGWPASMGADFGSAFPKLTLFAKAPPKPFFSRFETVRSTRPFTLSGKFTAR
jgi:hypothetical protein